MSDELLLRRLRIGWHDDDTPIWVSDAMTEAAARIEQLKAKNMRLSGMCYDLYADIQASNELGKALEEDAGQLREENTRLREALGKLECKCSANCDWERDDVCPSWIARAALNGESHE